MRKSGPGITAIHLAVGALVGFVVFAGIGATQYVATSLGMGMVLDIEGNVGHVMIPEAAWGPGIAAGLIAFLLYLARSLWWDSLVGRVSAAVVVVVLLVIGNVMFDDFYYRTFGAQGWAKSSALNAAQSMGTYAFVGVVIASTFVTARRRRRHGVKSNAA